MNAFIELLSSPPVLPTITLVTAFGAFLKILKKNQHAEKVMTVYEGGITVDELMAFGVLLLLIATIFSTIFAFCIGNFWPGFMLSLISLLLLLVFLMFFQLESCYLYLAGTLYLFVKK